MSSEQFSPLAVVPQPMYMPPQYGMQPLNYPMMPAMHTAAMSPVMHPSMNPGMIMMPHTIMSTHPQSPTQQNVILAAQQARRVESNITTLGRLAQTSGFGVHSQEDIARELDQAIAQMRTEYEIVARAKQKGALSASNEQSLITLRSNLCELLKAVNTNFYCEQKEALFALLIIVLDTDPITKKTANGVLEVALSLSAELDPQAIEKVSVPFQFKIARAFSAAVELYLNHYGKGHVNAVTVTSKNGLIDIQKKFERINTQEDPYIQMVNGLAFEGCKRLVSDNVAWKETIVRMSNLAKALGNLYNSDVGGFCTSLYQTVQGLDTKFTSKWFDALQVLKCSANNAITDTQKVMTIQAMLAKNQIKHGWQFTFAALELLGNIATQPGQDPDVVKLAFFGQTTLPGIVDFLDFKGFEKDAAVATKNDKKKDKDVRKIAEDFWTNNKQTLLVATSVCREAMVNRLELESRKVKERNESLVNELSVIVPEAAQRKTWINSAPNSHLLVTIPQVISPSTIVVMPASPPPVPPKPLKPISGEAQKAPSPTNFVSIQKQNKSDAKATAEMQKRLAEEKGVVMKSHSPIHAHTAASGKAIDQRDTKSADTVHKSHSPNLKPANAQSQSKGIAAELAELSTLAYGHEHLHNYDEAIKLRERAVAKDVNEPRSYYKLALTLMSKLNHTKSTNKKDWSIALTNLLKTKELIEKKLSENSCPELAKLIGDLGEDIKDVKDEINS